MGTDLRCQYRDNWRYGDNCTMLLNLPLLEDVSHICFHLKVCLFKALRNSDY